MTMTISTQRAESILTEACYKSRRLAGFIEANEAWSPVGNLPDSKYFPKERAALVALLRGMADAIDDSIPKDGP